MQVSTLPTSVTATTSPKKSAREHPGHPGHPHLRQPFDITPFHTPDNNLCRCDWLLVPLFHLCPLQPHPPGTGSLFCDFCRLCQLSLVPTPSVSRARLFVDQVSHQPPTCPATHTEALPPATAAVLSPLATALVAPAFPVLSSRTRRKSGSNRHRQMRPLLLSAPVARSSPSGMRCVIHTYFLEAMSSLVLLLPFYTLNTDRRTCDRPSDESSRMTSPRRNTSRAELDTPERPLRAPSSP